MSRFVWRGDYKTGQADIDAQHERLFALADQLVNAESTDQLKVYYMALFKHTREHFGIEEVLMKASKYPGYKQHIALHDELLGKLVNLSQAIHENRWDEELLVEIAEWFVEHIREVDSVLARYLARQVKVR